MFVLSRLNTTSWWNTDGELTENDVIHEEDNYWSYNENANWMLTLDGDYP